LLWRQPLYQALVEQVAQLISSIVYLFNQLQSYYKFFDCYSETDENT